MHPLSDQTFLVKAAIFSEVREYFPTFHRYEMEKHIVLVEEGEKIAVGERHEHTTEAPGYVRFDPTIFSSRHYELILDHMDRDDVVEIRSESVTIGYMYHRSFEFVRMFHVDSGNDHVHAVIYRERDNIRGILQHLYSWTKNREPEGIKFSPALYLPFESNPAFVSRAGGEWMIQMYTGWNTGPDHSFVVNDDEIIHLLGFENVQGVQGDVSVSNIRRYNETPVLLEVRIIGHRNIMILTKHGRKYGTRLFFLILNAIHSATNWSPERHHLLSDSDRSSIVTLLALSEQNSGISLPPRELLYESFEFFEIIKLPENVYPVSSSEVFLGLE